jgi:hypothetical protein
MEIVIPRRFCGPQNSGNGGYTCGRIAAFIDGPAEVTLKSPPPLETPLRVEKTGDSVKLVHEGREVAHARPQLLNLDIPAPPSWADAVAAAKRYNGLREHAYGTCFVCGPQRAPRDGLRIFCGPWQHGIVAGDWTPDETLEDGHGGVAPEFLWAAVDCPGEWSVVGRDDADAPIKGLPSTVLLGRLTGQVFRGLRVGEACTVIGWCLGIEERKYHVGAAVHARDGALVAASRATWLQPRGSNG